jgi:hypothetical protein
MSHKLILKNKFKPERKALRRRGSGDDEIEEIFTRRLIFTDCAGETADNLGGSHERRHI